MRLKPTVQIQDLIDFGFEIIVEEPLMAVRDKTSIYGVYINAKREIMYNTISMFEQDIKSAIIDMILADCIEEI